MDSINLDGRPCWYQHMVWSPRIRAPERLCPLCHEALNRGSKVILLLNNWQLFPNTLRGVTR